MATYAIGDVQGCMTALERLLAACAFDPARDRLWFVGDLVNRGPDSLAVLRFVRGLGERAVVVLGNHDIHALRVAEGIGKAHRKDTLAEFLAAPDRAELCDWLCSRPLFHREGDWALVHAGLAPQWSLADAARLSEEFRAALSGPGRTELLTHLWGDEPDVWDERLSGHERLRVIVNAMTRMRVCKRSGAMDLAFKGPLAEMPRHRQAWFDLPGARWRGEATVLCGHWSALGLIDRPDLVALDTGCLWGGELSAMRLEDRQVFQATCAGLPGTTHWR